MSDIMMSDIIMCAVAALCVGVTGFILWLSFRKDYRINEKGQVLVDLPANMSKDLEEDTKEFYALLITEIAEIIHESPSTAWIEKELSQKNITVTLEEIKKGINIALKTMIKGPWDLYFMFNPGTCDILIKRISSGGPFDANSYMSCVVNYTDSSYKGSKIEEISLGMDVGLLRDHRFNYAARYSEEYSEYVLK